MTMKREDLEDADTIENHLDYVYWYKADGERTAGKLPQDPYHVAKYTERGWTRRPPKVVDFNPTVEEENA